MLMRSFVVRIISSQHSIFDCRILQLLRKNSLAKASRLLHSLGKRKCNEQSFLLIIRMVMISWPPTHPSALCVVQ